MKNAYTLLTGGKNNAGDFLIKQRAKQLLSSLRPDRKIVDIDGWKELTEEDLEQINYGSALLLTGGPALQYNMYGKVYALVKDLKRIKVPIITFGIGYKDQNGSWENTKNYQLSSNTIRLLNRIKDDGYLSGVRDYHTLNALFHKGFDNFIVTGCPALYSLEHLNKEFNAISKIENIKFSLGVSYKESDSMLEQMLQTILIVKKELQPKDYSVLFHHKINTDDPRQAKILAFLKHHKIDHKDISGSENLLIEEYSNCHLHIGYRVHAHIFASSISRPSILLNEDSRGKGLQLVIGGLHLDSYSSAHWNLTNRIKQKLKIPFEKIIAVDNLTKDLIANTKYEARNNMPRIRAIRSNIDSLFPTMKSYIEQLP